MILKEIKPGMAIHCKNYEEKKALLEEAERLGYVWYCERVKPTAKQIDRIGNTIHFYDANKQNGFTADYKHITQSEHTGKDVIEFSDLIIPELSAGEAIKIFGEICKGSCQACPLYAVEPYEACENLCYENPEKIVEILAQWKANHEKKEQEIETVDICRIIEIQQDGRKRCVHEETIEKPITLEVEETLKRYCMEHEGEFIAVHEVVSRVKR